MDNLIGQVFDQIYRLDELIGVGGMANVYQGYDLKKERIVAIKVLRQEFLDNVELVRRFKNESKAISVLNHPNIVKVYDVSITAQLQYIVMEYLNGITLKEYMRQIGRALSWKDTIHFIAQVLQALEHAHANGVVHRDIKPQNIILLADGSVKVMDFGIARISRSENQTVTDKAIGSVHYISPEQAKGHTTDAKADIYSVGVMMYEMLTNTLPFDADSPVSVAMKQITDTAKPLREIDASIPEALEDIIERAMAKEPAARYPSASDMLADIEEFKKDPSIRFSYKNLIADTTTEKNIMTNQNKGTSSGTTAKKSVPNKKRKKKPSLVIPVMLGMALAFALGSAFLCYNIFTSSSNVLFSEKPDVQLENFIGMSQGDVKSNKEYTNNFHIKWQEEYNPNYEQGIIYEQSPRAPKQVKQGQTVVLKVSMGTQMLTVPDVTTMTRDSAQQKLREEGFTVTIRPERNSGAAVNTVVKTEPAVNEQLPQGSTITLYVAQAAIETEATVPDIRNLSAGDVIAALSNVRLIAGQVTEEYSASVAPGLVISQSVEPGTKVRIHSRINYSISLGPPPITLSLSYTGEQVVGKTTTFTATVGNADPNTVVWNVGTKSGTGSTFTVKWEAAGTYTIRAQVGGTPAEITLEVTKAPCSICGSTDHEIHPTPTPTVPPTPKPTPPPILPPVTSPPVTEVPPITETPPLSPPEWEE